MRSQQALCSHIGWLVTLALGGSCTGVTLEPTEVSDTVSSEACTTVLAEKLVDQKGFNLQVEGNSALRGTQLTIPANALEKPTMVRLLAGRNLKVDGTPNSVPVCVQTGQSTLSRPALLVLPYDPQKLGGRGVEYLALAGMRMRDEVPVESRMGGLLAIDEPNRLAGAEIDRDGIYQIISIGVGQPAITPDLSVLFVIDSSGSMAPKQKMLNAKFPDFFKKITRYNGDPRINKCIQYNVGVLTTDMGKSATTSGDNGQLQNKFCDPGRFTGDAQTACKEAHCEMVTPLSATQQYIHRGDLPTAEEQERQFRCLASVGDLGSGVEQPLESLSQFLKTEGDAKTTTNFFRKEAMNAIVFLTDEGDCSFESTRRAEFYSDMTHPDDNQRCLFNALSCDAPGLDTPKDARLSCAVKLTGTVLKSPNDYADELLKFMDILNPDHKAEQRGLLYIRGLWPLQQNMKTFHSPIEFDLVVNKRPPADGLGRSAFCWDEDEGVVAGIPTITGSPQIRLDAFAQRVAGGRGAGTSPQVEVGSICSKADRDTILDDLADTFQNVGTKDCRTTLLP